MALLADILAHLGQTEKAIKLLRQEIAENPDQDQAYLSLALVLLRAGNAAVARETLQQGLARTPDAGELLWGMGVVSVMEGQEEEAEQYLQKSVDPLPEWPGSYSALAVLYYQTGQIDKARETTERFRQGGRAARLMCSGSSKPCLRPPRTPVTRGSIRSGRKLGNNSCKSPWPMPIRPLD